MRFPIRLSGRRKVVALTGASALVVAGLVTLPAAIAHAAPGCDITYTSNDWTEAPGSGGFTASITVKNTGDPITSWSLKFAFPSGQTLTAPGWSATWAQSGANITGTSLSYNGTLGTGASTSIGFNGRWSGANTKPTAFTLNNTTCTTGGVTPSPSTGPSNSPSPQPSASTSPSPQARSIIITPSSVSVAEGSSSSVTVKLSAAPTSNVTVALARSGDTSISAPSSVTLTPSNAVAGVSVAISAAEDSDQTNGTATVAASASGYTGASLAVTEIDNDITQSGKADNPYAGARGYVNPEWSAKAASVSGGSRVSNLSTAVWLDRIAAIEGTSGSSSNGSMGLEDHLDEALRQYNAGSGPLT
ncbi:cellulose binding domain-containing protein, partial [Catellatospora aurea]